MLELSVNKFRANIKTFVDKAIDEHEPLKVRRRAGRDFIIISAEDWEREQETLYVLQNSTLMNQIAESVETYQTSSGYKPNKKELNEINSV
ncbi:MAG: type II toxin-antitoxin system Phd/YefM family antitoxin [Bacteroidales bacterium]|nr:type II toxin-antitoxin system Phd/YefM family antitoxin [Bacteroidales bacterium]